MACVHWKDGSCDMLATSYKCVIGAFGEGYSGMCQAAMEKFDNLPRHEDTSREAIARTCGALSTLTFGTLSPAEANSDGSK